VRELRKVVVYMYIRKLHFDSSTFHVAANLQTNSVLNLDTGFRRIRNAKITFT